MSAGAGGFRHTWVQETSLQEEVRAGLRFAGNSALRYHFALSEGAETYASRRALVLSRSPSFPINAR
jgi:hypothetical protein